VKEFQGPRKGQNIGIPACFVCRYEKKTCALYGLGKGKSALERLRRMGSRIFLRMRKIERLWRKRGSPGRAQFLKGKIYSHCSFPLLRWIRKKDFEEDFYEDLRNNELVIRIDVGFKR